ncbi:hypothetical protein A1O7_00834 [Cladophialophora yegresii CBS 114405]|uniref:Uncharacterized protein n=1 Tax=Cladophialophora yegresii CBS 114405 TaxID=1182544 RepID=W9W986_9EURO|nr:uncharacterized protein A1O7_00834 [Cladophialophora yegresii CBS 114405]EXJ64498.1 hypothetical protein A1O7_00834 [Cladophialophora yegresii CBS 114405]
MVTTRLGSRIGASSPEADNKRKRFRSVDADDPIVVEVPLRESKADNEREISGGVVPNHDSDEDAAPEVVSSKAAARQARELPNRSLQGTGNKRRKTAERHLLVEKPDLTPSVLGESKSEDATISDAASLQLDDMPPQNEASMTGILQPLNEEIGPSKSIILETEISDIDVPQIPGEGTGDLAALDAQKPATAQSLPNIAKNAVGDEAPIPAPEPAAEVIMAHVTNEPEDPVDVVPQMRSLEEAASRPGDEGLADTQMKEPHWAVEADRSSPGDSTTQLNVEAQQQSSEDNALPQSAEPNSTLSMPEADMQATRTTLTLEEQISGTPRSNTSSVITPVWRTRAYDETSLTAVQSPSLAPAVKATRAHSNILSRHQHLISKKSKLTSLQQYRDQLLNRHSRTTNWGPPGFRKTKFVGT